MLKIDSALPTRCACIDLVHRHLPSFYTANTARQLPEKLRKHRVSRKGHTEIPFPNLFPFRRETLFECEPVSRIKRNERKRKRERRRETKREGNHRSLGPPSIDPGFFSRLRRCPLRPSSPHLSHQPVHKYLSSAVVIDNDNKHFFATLRDCHEIPDPRSRNVNKTIKQLASLVANKHLLRDARPTFKSRTTTLTFPSGKSLDVSSVVYRKTRSAPVVTHRIRESRSAALQ